MRPFWTTFLPMLAVAALVLWGGERLGRRPVEERVPADRDRLFDFTASLREELDRLDAIYAEHLVELVNRSFPDDDVKLAARCANLVGVRTLHVFSEGREVTKVEGKKPPVGQGTRIPEVVAEGAAGRIVPRNAFTLSKDLWEPQFPASGWLRGDGGGSHRAYWSRVGGGRLIVIVLDQRELERCLEDHLGAWSEGPLAPLRDGGELFAIEGPGGQQWISSPGDKVTGPAAFVLPHRTNFGDFQVVAWDKIKQGSTHDPAILAAAGCVAFVVLLTGSYLWSQQRRALKLAEERVSFVNQVSHELGTPLTNILLNLDLAGRAMSDRPAETRRRLALVNEEVQRLGRLVSNVLTFSRSERETLDLRQTACVPDEVVAGVLEQFQASLDRRKVTVEWHRGAEESIRLDCDALAQIAGNLISNVEKYAAAGGWLGLETRILADRFYLRVSDCGPGIPAGEQERIFGAFERVHRGLSEGSSGTGLGLAIARDLARRMGGDLVLVPSERGARFELGLPAKATFEVVSDKNSSVA